MTIDRTTGRIISIEPIPEGVDVNEYMQQVIHDCPECRAARERGEQPVSFSPEAIARPDRETRQVRRARRRRERKARRQG